MAYNGLNLENVKNQNRSSILKLLNDHGPMSRKDISARLGLTPASVTTLCAELLAQNILVELGEVQQGNRAGRRKILLGINYTYRYVLSISIEMPSTCITLCDLRGEHCSTRRIPTDIAAPPELFLKQVANVGKALLWENSIGREQLLGAGVSVPGPVDREKGVSTHAYRIWNQSVQVASLLAQALECTILLENNVKAFARAELTYGLGRTQENLLLLKWGPGVGSAIIAQGHIYDSGKYRSAEIGHVWVEKNGRLCRCGRYGCLETRVASHPIARHLRQVCSPEKTPLLWAAVDGHPEKITVHDLEALAALDEPAMWEALDADIELLADVVGGMLTMLTPDHLILYGDMFKLPHFREKFLAACKRYDPAYDEDYVRISELDQRIAYIGPLAVVTNELFYQG